ncbi:MAG: PPK2 family polyphosphate:nucleotide phosphotransferase [Rhodothermales bacterium]
MRIETHLDTPFLVVSAWTGYRKAGIIMIHTSPRSANMLNPEVHRVEPQSSFKLAELNPAGTNGLHLSKKESKALLSDLRGRMADLQERLYAESNQALLVVLQAMDTGGKDSTIRAVTEGVNPQGVWVRSFKAPSKRELARDYLWRVHREVPPKGQIGIFNRSHYEDVLIVRVHGWASPAAIDARYDQINQFEQLLHGTGTRVLKIMLNISKDYQLERLRRRLGRPDKHWKFNPGDLQERALWQAYMEAYEVAIGRCSTKTAPWYVIPAETRWYRNLAIAQLIVNTLESMDPQFPAPTFDPAEFAPESLI